MRRGKGGEGAADCRRCRSGPPLPPQAQRTLTRHSAHRPGARGSRAPGAGAALCATSLSSARHAVRLLSFAALQGARGLASRVPTGTLRGRTIGRPACCRQRHRGRAVIRKCVWASALRLGSLQCSRRARWPTKVVSQPCPRQAPLPKGDSRCHTCQERGTSGTRKQGQN